MKTKRKEGIFMEKIKLDNGVEMPMLGIGTFLLTPDQAEEFVYNALKAGYRLH